MSRLLGMNAYEVLGVPGNATEQQIRGARKALAKKWHPDRCNDNPRAGRMMAQINAAVDTLLDPKKRLALDAELAIERATGAKDSVAKRKPAKRTATKRRTANRATAAPPPSPPPTPPAPGLFVNLAAHKAHDMDLLSGTLFIFLGAALDHELGTAHLMPPDRRG